MKTLTIFLAGLAMALLLANGYLLFAKYDADAKLTEDYKLMWQAAVKLRAMDAELKRANVRCSGRSL
jgi:hypothetical protein